MQSAWYVLGLRKRKGGRVYSGMVDFCGTFALTQGLGFLVFHETLECALLFPTESTFSQVELWLFSLQRWPRKGSGLEVGCSLRICPEERRDHLGVGTRQLSFHPLHPAAEAGEGISTVAVAG